MSFKLGDVLLKTSDRPHPQPCYRKRRHETREAAVEHLRQILGGGKCRDPGSLETYRCNKCGGYHVGHDPKKDRDMSDIRTALTDGGVVTVFLGNGYEVPEQFKYHPQVHAVVANALAQDRVGEAIPSNTKAVIYTDRIDHRRYMEMQGEIKRRRLTYLLRNTPERVEQALRDIVPPPRPAPAPAPEPEPEPAADTGGEGRKVSPRGSVVELVDAHWEQIREKSTADGARLLFPIAQERGLLSTIASLEQGIRVRKRKEGRSDTPQSIVPENLKVLKILDDSIAGLQLVRDYVAQTEAKNTELQGKMDQMKEMFGRLMAE